MNSVDDIFMRVTLDRVDRQYHNDLYQKIHAIAKDIDANCPDSAEKTLAFRALHQALMHSGSALSKKNKYK